MSHFIAMGDLPASEFVAKSGGVYNPKTGAGLTAVKALQVAINKWNKSYPSVVGSVSTDGSVGPATVAASNKISAFILKKYPSMSLRSNADALWVAMHADTYANTFQSILGSMTAKAATWSASAGQMVVPDKPSSSGSSFASGVSSLISGILSGGAKKPVATVSSSPSDMEAATSVYTGPGLATSGIGGISTTTLLLVGGGLAAFFYFKKGKKGRK